MSVIEVAAAIETMADCDFEAVQRGLGRLSIADRDYLDKRATEIFDAAQLAATVHGPMSPEAQSYDERVLLYARLVRPPVLYDRRSQTA